MDWWIHHRCSARACRHGQRLEIRLRRWWQGMFSNALVDGPEAQSKSRNRSKNASGVGWTPLRDWPLWAITTRLIGYELANASAALLVALNPWDYGRHTRKARQDCFGVGGWCAGGIKKVLEFCRQLLALPISFIKAYSARCIEKIVVFSYPIKCCRS